jgi:predicted transglutaminase-like cysteine proteinase
MRRVSILAAIAAAAIVTVSQMTAVQSADERLLGIPTGAMSAPPHLKLAGPVLPPFAYTMFCLRYQDECRTHPLFRGGPVLLTEARWASLKDVNQTVNRAIIPETNEFGLATEAWLIDPERGDCNDYAVSKRHRLLRGGWPARTLLLGEVVTVWGKHHLVLVVLTRSGDLVLDNLTPQIRPWSRAPYRWVRIQSPGNPRYWNTVAPRGV